MRAMDLIWFACLRVFLRTLKPKARFRFMRDVSDIVGQPGVIPFIQKDAATEVSTARETWQKVLAKLAAEA